MHKIDYAFLLYKTFINSKDFLNKQKYKRFLSVFFTKDFFFFWFKGCVFSTFYVVFTSSILTSSLFTKSKETKKRLKLKSNGRSLPLKKEPFSKQKQRLRKKVRSTRCLVSSKLKRQNHPSCNNVLLYNFCKQMYKKSDFY